MSSKYGFNVARVLVAIIMLLGGAAKLAGVPEVHESFSILGLPSWFGYLIGACEVAGAVGIFINPLSALAAVGLGSVMIGAVYFHVAHTPMEQGIPALVVLLLSIFIAIKQKPKLFKFAET
ncbi:MAG: DoxX family protein [Pseudomonadales bacterium]|nr:DoxX family protein [Pseudomonadales bacterium]